MFKPTMPPRMRDIVLILFILLSITLSILFNSRRNATPPRTSLLHTFPEKEPATAFRQALSTWTSAQPTTRMLEVAAATKPRDAANGLFQHLRETVPRSGIIDIGANKGYPVTRLALSAGAKWVLAVEPDERNYKHLANISKLNSVYRHIKGAASDKVGNVEMAFHKERDDFTCFHCLNTTKDDVYTQMVDVHTVDRLIDGLDGEVMLLKTDTQGHEAEVLTGAQQLLNSGRVKGVIMEFDPALFQTYDNAKKAVSLVTKAGLRCVHLAFPGGKKGAEVPYFGEEITMGNLRKFWDYAKGLMLYTDVFCLRK